MLKFCILINSVHNIYVFLKSSQHSKKFLGRRQKNFKIRNGKLQFSCFRPTFGPIWTSFTCFRPIFGPVSPNFTVSDKNLSKLDQKLVWNKKIAFSHVGLRHFPVSAPKIFFNVGNPVPSCWGVSEILKSCWIGIIVVQWN